MDDSERRQRNRERLDALQAEREEQQRAKWRAAYRRQIEKKPRAYNEERAKKLRKELREQRRNRNICTETGCFGYSRDGSAMCPDCQVRKRIKNNENYKTRKQNRQCLRCDNMLPEGWENLSCKECKIRRSRNYRILFDNRRKEGLCVRCKSPAGKYARCNACREKANALKRKPMLTPGVCYHCKAPSGHYRDCSTCRLKESERKKALRRAVPKGRCKRCMKPSGDYAWCADCRAKKRAWNEAHNKKRKAERQAAMPKCIYCHMRIKGEYKSCEKCRAERAAYLRIMYRHKRRWGMDK